MLTDPLLTALWLGALAAAATGHDVELTFELEVLAICCLERWPPAVKA